MLTGTYDPIFVILSIVIATMASYSALDLAGRITASRGAARAGWLAGGASVMGLGVWSMHFVGMLALHLPRPIAYGLPLMLVSVGVACVASLLALAVVSRRVLGVAMLLPASLLMGIAIAGMHYVGMASMYVSGADMHYRPAIVALSVVIAVVASMAALWLAFRLRADLSARGVRLKVLSAVLMGVAISGMHYTGMAGVRFTGGSRAPPPVSRVVASEQLGIAVAVGTLLISVLALIGAVIDRSMRARAVFTEELATANARLEASLRDAERAREQRQESERALAEKDEQLRQSQKMDAIGNLAGGIAHDFNNLLTVIRLNAQPLLDELPPERHADHREVMASVERAAVLTRQLLAYGRRQVLRLAAVDVNAVVEGAESMLRRVIPEDIDMRITTCTTPCFVLADQGQLEQVVVNLVVNARDAMPRGGTLNLETGVVEAGADDAVPASLRHTELVMISVRDTGSGMSAHVREHALEPFFTTKEQGAGSGLGLSMAYGIIRQSAGDLVIESTPGAGTTVRLFLPRVPVPMPEPPHPPNADAPGVVHETILLVEDEPAVRRATSRLLRRLGYTVHEAENGEDAIARFGEALVGIDALVSDLVMPRMGGIELLQRCRAVRETLPALFLSGYSAEAVAGTNPLSAPLLQKPFTADALAAALRNLLGRTAG